jgi:hypothetical protein
MKKTVYSILALAALAFSACTNTNSVNPRPTDQIISKVTISGRIKAELNNSAVGRENAPDGLKIVVGISTRDFALSPNGSTYATKYYETTTAGGNYTIEVEVGPYGSNPTIFFPTFRADVAVNNTTSVSTIFGADNVDISLVKGQNYIIDYNY